MRHRKVRPVFVLAILLLGWAPPVSPNPHLQISYLSGPRRIVLQPPGSSQRIRCRGYDAWVELGVPDVLVIFDQIIDNRIAKGESVGGYEKTRSKLAPTRGPWTSPTCPIPEQMVADVLESGRAVVFDFDADAYLGHLVVRRVAWNTRDPGCEYSGDARIFTRASGRFEPGWNMQGCGKDCLFQSVDHSMHVTRVLCP